MFEEHVTEESSNNGVEDQKIETVQEIVTEKVAEAIKEVMENGAESGYNPIQTWKKGRDSFIKTIISTIMLIALTKIAVHTGIQLSVEMQTNLIIGGVAVFNAAISIIRNWIKHKHK